MPNPRGPGGPGGPRIRLGPKPGSSGSPGLSAATAHRMARGFHAGVTAALVMAGVTYALLAAGLWPAGELVPHAVLDHLIPIAIPAWLASAMAISVHLLYGGFWGTILVLARDPVRWFDGLATGAILWLVQQLAVLPLAGWGIFAQKADARLIVFALLTHLAYGLVLGLLARRLDDGAQGAPEAGGPVGEAGAT
ncbi:MAG: hypothetical protein R3185_05295 [Candidatus Thermoplasmatota archaeon]|nr:hypothetical protein [Candidatus Thermoplasmatota archaeon]